METASAVFSAFVVIGLGCLGTVNSVLNSAVGSSAAAGVVSTGAEQPLPSATDDDPAAIPPTPGFTYNGTALLGISAVYCLFAPLMAIVSLVCLVYKKRLTKCCTLRSKMAWWHALGGVCGVIGMLASVLCTPRLGALLFGALSVSGALISSVVLDHAGFAGMTVRKATLVKAAAASIALIGVAITAVASTQSVPDPSGAPVHEPCRPCTVGSDSASASAPCCSDDSMHAMASHTLLRDTADGVSGPALHILAACSVASFLAGTLGPMQALLNWRLGHALAHKSMALVVSATMAGVLSLIVLGAYLGIAAASAPDSQEQIDVAGAIASASWAGLKSGSVVTPWMWLGAVGAIVTKAGSVMFPKRIGTSAYIILVLTGEMGISLVLDHVGALGLPRRPATAARAIGIGIIWKAALLMRFSDSIEGALVKQLQKRGLVVPPWLVSAPPEADLPELVSAKAASVASSHKGTPEPTEPEEEEDRGEVGPDVGLLEKMEKGIAYTADRAALPVSDRANASSDSVLRRLLPLSPLSPPDAAASPQAFTDSQKTALELARLQSIHTGQCTEESGAVAAGEKEKDGRLARSRTISQPMATILGTAGDSAVTRTIRALSSRASGEAGDASSRRVWWPHSTTEQGMDGPTCGVGAGAGGGDTHTCALGGTEGTIAGSAPARGALRASSWFGIPVRADAGECLLSEYSPQSPSVLSPSVLSPGIGLRLSSHSVVAERTPGHTFPPLHRKMTSLDAMCDALLDADDEE